MVYDKFDSYDEEDGEEEKPSGTLKGRAYLGVSFKCCSVYSRIYKNKEGTAYVGRCPRCMRLVRVAIGEEGTNNRFFDAY